MDRMEVKRLIDMRGLDKDMLQGLVYALTVMKDCKNLEEARNKIRSAIKILSWRPEKEMEESRRPRGRMMRESAEDDELVGKQKFTVGELKRAWKELERRIDDDEEIAEYGYRDKLDIRGYAKDKQHIRNHNYRSVWTDFSFEGLKDEFEDNRDTIVDADYEVYFNDLKERMSDTVEHGIIIKNGKIVEVY